MTIRKVLLAAIVALILAAVQSPVSAQMDQPFDRKIDKKFIAETIDSVSRTLNEYYIFGDVAKEMEKHLRKEYKNGSYDTITSLVELMDRFMGELRDICHDRHFGMRTFSDEDIAEMSADLTDDQREKLRQRHLAMMEYENFGFYKLERLPGNIGYLDLRGFNDASVAGGTAIAAMNFLSNSSAIIIDLRQNGGGSPSMIQLISSYFFDEPQHLNSFYIRSEDTIKQFWTQAYVEGKKMIDTPLYVLTSQNTFSAAEEFTYNLKNMKRATIIGETTGGGAHPVDDHYFANLNVGMRVPFGRAINPITGTNWEGTGVEPDIQVPADDALMTARLEAMKKVKETETDEGRLFSLGWDIDNMEAIASPYKINAELLKKYAGQYEVRSITYENGELIYQREGSPPHRMIPMNDDTFCFDDLDYFRLHVVVDESGDPTMVEGLYRQGYTDSSARTN